MNVFYFEGDGGGVGARGVGRQLKLKTMIALREGSAILLTSPLLYIFIWNCPGVLQMTSLQPYHL